MRSIERSAGDMQGDMHRVGGGAALLHAAGFLGRTALLIVIVQALHWTSTSNLFDPSHVLPGVLQQPAAFAGYGAMSLLIGATTLVLALALDERVASAGMGGVNLRRAALAAAAAAAAFFVLQGLLSIVGLPEIAVRYGSTASSHDQASAAFYALQAVTDSALYAALVTYGAWVVMISWLAVRRTVFSRSLNYVGIVWGLLMLLSPFDAALAILQVLGLIWAIWIGIVLLREGREPAAGTPAQASRRAAIVGEREVRELSDPDASRDGLDKP
jgi:hypothetical protein